MSGVRTFFRHCPSCGRRFEVRLVSKEEVDSEDIKEDLKNAPNPLAGRAVASSLANPLFPKRALTLSEDRPAILDVEDFQYTFKCKHCGHEWSEIRRTDRDHDAPKGYSGD